VNLVFVVIVARVLLIILKRFRRENEKGAILVKVLLCSDPESL
jgi:hypothetical protein